MTHLSAPCINTITTMIFLGGGGSSQDESLVFDAFLNPGQRILILPWAQPRQRWDGMKAWIDNDVASPRGQFQPARLADEDTPFADFDVVVIPGGNTFQLLHELRTRNLVSALRDFSRSGHVYGGSAGALILGSDIAICDGVHGGMDSNNVNLVDTHAADLVGGCVVHPHYEEAEWEAHCAKWAREKGAVVLGVPERGGLQVTNDNAVNLGPEDVVVFRKDTKSAWKAGEMLEIGALRGEVKAHIS